MYESYWQIQSKPFEDTGDPNFYYPAETHQGALLKLRYAVENKRPAALLAGGAGLGKTLLVHALRRQVSESFAPFAHLVFPAMPPHELVAYLATELGANVDSNSGLAGHVRALEQRLAENIRQGRHAVVVVDEAHLLDDVDSLEFLRLLLNFQLDGVPGVTLLLVGQPGLLPILDRQAGLEERLSVKCLLRPLNLEESISYVNHRLTAAGATRAIFEDQALEALFHLTYGAPRQINRLCDLALLIGYAEELPSISAAQIEAVSQELVAVTPE